MFEAALTIDDSTFEFVAAVISSKFSSSVLFFFIKANIVLCAIGRFVEFGSILMASRSFNLYNTTGTATVEPKPQPNTDA